MRRTVFIFAAMLMAGCQPDKAPPAADAVEPHFDFAGRWTGPEGMFIDIAADPQSGPGHYRIRTRWGLDTTMQGEFKGMVESGSLAFTRSDGAQKLTPGNGDATGMKWLAGKQDCLIVRTGEGYCRD